MVIVVVCSFPPPPPPPWRWEMNIHDTCRRKSINFKDIAIPFLIYRDEISIARFIHAKEEPDNRVCATTG